MIPSPERITSVCARLAQEFGFTAVVAGELEFYLHGAAAADMPAFWRDVETALAASGIGLFNYGQEKGEGQWEIALSPRADASVAAAELDALKAIVVNAAQAHALHADFAAKPLPDQPGSGLHIHLHLEDAQGARAFYKKDDSMSDPLKWALGGLLATMRDHMPSFAPTEASRARFLAGSNAPTTLSWGANNRSCALRLPDINAPHRHIEHRVAGADADPHAVIGAILEGVLYGLMHRCDPGPQIYGNAEDAVYGLGRL